MKKLKLILYLFIFIIRGYGLSGQAISNVTKVYSDQFSGEENTNIVFIEGGEYNYLGLLHAKIDYRVNENLFSKDGGDEFWYKKDIFSVIKLDKQNNYVGSLDISVNTKPGYLKNSGSVNRLGLVYEGENLYIFGNVNSRADSIFINEEFESEVDTYSSFYFKVDEDFNILDRYFLHQDSTNISIQKMQVKNGKVFLAGEFSPKNLQWESFDFRIGDTILYPLGNGDDDLYISSNYLAILDDETKEVLKADAFGAGIRTGISSMQVDEDENVFLGVYAGAVVYRGFGKEYYFDNWYPDDGVTMCISKEDTLKYMIHHGSKYFLSPPVSTIGLKEGAVIEFGLNTFDTLFLNEESYFTDERESFAYVLKRDLNGEIKWLSKLRSIVGNPFAGANITGSVVDKQENIWVTGSCRSSSFYNYDIITKDEEGNFIWFLLKLDGGTGELSDKWILKSDYLMYVKKIVPLGEDKLKLVIEGQIETLEDKILFENEELHNVSRSTVFVLDVDTKAFTGSIDISIREQKFFPNPISSGGIINCNFGDSKTKLELINLNGQVVWNGYSGERIGIHPAGIYGLKYVDKGKPITEKIIITE